VRTLFERHVAQAGRFARGPSFVFASCPSDQSAAEAFFIRFDPTFDDEQAKLLIVIALGRLRT
jgi:hypothetical protein